MKTWKIPVAYEMMGVIEVVADTLAEAMELARDEAGNIPLPDNASYVDDSWELATDDEQAIRELYNRGQEDEND